MEIWEDKLKKIYVNAVVDKKIILNFELYNLPRFVTEYLVSASVEKNGQYDGIIKLENFLNSNYPKKNSCNLNHYKLQQEGSVNIIDNFKMYVNVEKSISHKLYIPAMNIRNAEIEDHEIIKKNPRLLTTGLWGLAKIVKRGVDDPVVVEKFQPFQISEIDIELYKSGRSNFSTLEWVDILIASIGLNPSRFSLMRNKLIIISRLLPLVQKSMFLFEFGLPGTGKTYIFDNLSSSCFVISGSLITPAVLFKNCKSNKDGLLKLYDAILFDEIDKIQNNNLSDEVVNKLLKFMESNSYDRCGEEFTSDTSLIFSGNVEKGMQNGKVPDYLNSLPNKLKSGAFLDRINGVIPGWEIAPLSKKNGDFAVTHGFSADYFSSVLSELRHEDWEARIEPYLDFSQSTTNRDQRAIIKTICGFLKLIYPNFCVDQNDACFQCIVDYAVEMRTHVSSKLLSCRKNEKYIC